MTDRELLEAAARSAGIDLSGARWHEDHEAFVFLAPRTPNWNPLTNDGDALRLAVNLRLNIGFCIESIQDHQWEIVEAFPAPDDDGRSHCPSEDFGNDPYAATRRAIVRAAAALPAPHSMERTQSNE